MGQIQILNNRPNTHILTIQRGKAKPQTWNLPLNVMLNFDFLKVKTNKKRVKFIHLTKCKGLYFLDSMIIILHCFLHAGTGNGMAKSLLDAVGEPCRPTNAILSIIRGFL